MDEVKINEHLFKGKEKWISIDPKIRFGKPHFTGTRVPVYLVMDRLAMGETIQEIADSYELGVEKIKIALHCIARPLKTGKE